MSRVLFLAPMHREYVNMKDALKWSKVDFEYKVVECGVGKANAAATTAQECMDDYDAVILIGYAAASYKYKQGDFVVIGKVRYHDVVVPKGLVPELEQEYALDGEDNILLTGDVFVNRDLALKLQLKYGKMCLFDMEGAAVAQICEWTNQKLFIAKIVSDIPTDLSSSFQKFVEEHNDFSQFVSFAKAVVD